MTTEFAQRMIDAADTDGIEMTMRADYSGRGTYGKTTVAVTCDSWVYFAAVVARAVSMVDGNLELPDGTNMLDNIFRLSSDSMGRDSIVIY